MMVEVFASLRSAAMEKLDEEISSLESAGIDGYHIDVMDGRFVAESCFEPEFVRNLRSRSRRTLDVHLLTLEPEALVQEYVEAGADRLAFHVETSREVASLLDRIRKLGAAAGLVLLPSTAIESIEELLADVDFVNPLGVDPTRREGFTERTYERIRWLRQRRQSRSLRFRIQADGGVWAKTRDGLVDAGADELVGGYPIFSSQDYAEAVRSLREGG